MSVEIECKFIRQNHDEIRQRITALHGTLVQPERIMIRANYDFPDLRLAKTQSGWIRVRDEGDKITLSYKQSDDLTLHGMEEVSIEVDSFEKSEQFLHSIGITKKKSYQETKRESWLLDNVQIELDTWPWLSPFIELEAPSDDALKRVVHKLGLHMEDALHGSVIPAYQAEYDITADQMANWSEYRFDMPVPEWLEKARKVS